MKNKKLGDNNENEINNLINKLLTIVNCNAFQNVKKLVLSNNNLNDNHLNLIKDNFIDFLKKSNIEIIDVRNNPITEKTISDFINLHVENKNKKRITILSDYNNADYADDNNTNNTNNNDTTNDTDNITLFIPEIIFDKLTKLFLNNNNRKTTFDDLLKNVRNIVINNNLKNNDELLSEEKTNKNIVEKPQQSTGLLGLGGLLYLGGDAINYANTNINPNIDKLENIIPNSGVKIIIPKNTFYSFLNMSDKNNRIDNLNKFISSINDIEVLNNFTVKEKRNYLKNIQQIYSARGGKKKTNKKRKNTNKRKKTSTFRKG
jgi:hypothetical protein